MTNQASKARRLKRRLLWVLLALIVVAGCVILGISGYAASSLTQFERVPIKENPADFGLRYVNVSFPSRDGLMLRGWWLEAGDDKHNRLSFCGPALYTIMWSNTYSTTPILLNNQEV